MSAMNAHRGSPMTLGDGRPGSAKGRQRINKKPSVEKNIFRSVLSLAKLGLTVDPDRLRSANGRGVRCMTAWHRCFANAFRLTRSVFCVLVGAGLSAAACAAAAPAITTYHYDNFRTGWNQGETALTPANVGNLRLQQSVVLVVLVVAQAILVSDVIIAGGMH